MLFLQSLFLLKIQTEHQRVQSKFTNGGRKGSIVMNKHIAEGIGQPDLWRHLEKLEINIAAQANVIRAVTAYIFYQPV